MIGVFNIDEPAADGELIQMVESHRGQTRQPYAAILMFGLAGTVDCSEEVRRYAGYRHLREDPGDGPAWLELARLHAAAGEFDRAHAILDELDRHGAPGLYPEIYGEDIDVHRAHFLADAGRPAEALSLFDELARRHGESAVHRHSRASALHEMERHEDAADGYAEALAALDEIEAADDDDGETDFAAVRAYLRARRDDALAGRPFAGVRPLILSELRDEE